MSSSESRYWLSTWCMISDGISSGGNVNVCGPKVREPRPQATEGAEAPTVITPKRVYGVYSTRGR